MLLEGKKALITGSRRGIGRGIALALAREGCDIGLNDVERDAEAAKTVQAVEALGRRVTYGVGDISNGAQVNRLFDDFLAAHGRVDILVNNPYWASNKPFLEISEEAWDRTMDVCVKGYFLCSQRAARDMVRQEPSGGSIVSISSVHADRVWRNDTAYGVAKAAVIRLMMSVALDLSGTGVRANAIAPGYIDSRVLPPEREHERGVRGYGDNALTWIPTRRIGVPEDIAGVVVFLCSPLGSYVNGTCIYTDGGLLVGGTPGENS
jgi:NAD(P)-dependent dehydrogenase (short-subunit alcohol dehydrogenase family)